MDGATFLGRVQQLSPDSVRMMLTGSADFDTAIAAVNRGSIFRFMQKPIGGDELEVFLRAGLQQYALVDSMRRAAVAEHTLLAKSQFLATVSHELLTPLTVIRSTTEILAHFADDEPKEVRGEFLATISSYARHLEGMVGQLLLMADLDTLESCPIDETSFALVDVLHRAIAQQAEAAPADRRPIVLTEASMPIYCRGDARMVETAIAQVLANACRFSPELAPVSIHLRCDARSIHLDIQDQGAGVPAGIADKVFEPFVQCVDVLHDKPAGLGLGLTIARRIVQRHGGTITLAPADGGGTLARITLPM